MSCNGFRFFSYGTCCVRCWPGYEFPVLGVFLTNFWLILISTGIILILHNIHSTVVSLFTVFTHRNLGAPRGVKLCPHICCMFVAEDQLQVVYLHSCVLAEYLLSTEFISLQTVTRDLDLDPSDIPLLLVGHLSWPSWFAILIGPLGWNFWYRPSWLSLCLS